MRQSWSTAPWPMVPLLKSPIDVRVKGDAAGEFGAVGSWISVVNVSREVGIGTTCVRSGFSNGHENATELMPGSGLVRAMTD